MKEKILAMKAALRALTTKARGIGEEAAKKTGTEADELQVLLSQTITEAKSLRDQIADLEFLDSTDAWLTEPAAARKTQRVDEPSERISYVKSRNVRNFTRGSVAERDAKAYRFGSFAAAVLTGNAKAFEWCVEHGVAMKQDVGGVVREVKTMKETVNTTGGFLVPLEFDQELIDLREAYGVFRANARIVLMSGDKKLRSRRVSGLTAYFAAEAGSVTESEKAWDQLELSAKKLMTYTRFSSELNEDAMIDIGDDLMGEAGYAFAAKEDDCGFNGDATSTYGGIVGLRQRLVDVYTASGGVGLTVGAGATYASLTLANFNSVIGTLPEYAERPDTAWYVSKFFWATVMARLANAAGGVTKEEIEGRNVRTFQGYPVHVSQKMPKVTATAQVCALFGSLQLSSDFGDRRRTTVSMTEHRYHDTDEIGVRATERFDIQNHSVGDTTDAGPIVGLITA